MRLRILAAVGMMTVVIASACGSSDDSNGKTPGSSGGHAGATGGTVGSSGKSSGGTSANAGEPAAGGDVGASGQSNSTGGSGATGGGSATGGVSSSSGGSTTQAGASGAGDVAGAGAGSGPTCKPYGDLCAGGAECCSQTCNPDTHTCESSIVACGAPGAGCNTATDCCNLRCENSICASDACVSDGGSCTSDAECCGGTCGADQTCTPLNVACKTSGNSCGTDGECCSKSCVNGQCNLAVSWCIQPGDICTRDQDCCSSTCTKATGASIGTCTVPPTGSSFCGGVDGLVCDGCNSCCSRLCAPGPSGKNICQPASGCHVTGDLCRKDADCCGGDPDSGLPGAGNVTCEIAAGSVLGICRNPNSCNPQGNVCHYKDDPSYMCSVSSARANCCDGMGSKSGACQLDALGVPRCYALPACRGAGETCASVADCCDSVPCVPDSDGVLRCADIPPDQPKCITSGGSCSIDGDCCPGTTCIRAPGSTDGVCSTSSGSGGTGGTGGTGGSGGTAGSGTGGSSGAATGGTSGSGGTGGTGGTGTCSSYGQLCDSGTPCCSPDVPCNGGICRYTL